MSERDKIMKYQPGPLDEDKLETWRLPSGGELKVYPVFGHKVFTGLFLSGFVPDPRKHVPDVKEMTVYDDDILVCAYPKAGTHWVWEVTKMLTKGKAEYDPDPKEVAMLEFHSLDLFNKMARPRVLNTHWYVDQIPKGFLDGRGKVIFVQRNPKDVAVSFYHHLKAMKIKLFQGEWDDYMHCVKNYGGVFMDWFEYTQQFEKEIQSNKKLTCLCLYYEDMKKDPIKTVLDIARYIGIPCSDELAKQIAEACNFQNLKQASANLKYDSINDTKPNPEFENPDAMYRKGVVGDWKNFFTIAQNEEFDEIFQKKMPDTCFHYTYA